MKHPQSNPTLIFLALASILMVVAGIISAISLLIAKVNMGSIVP